MTVGILCIATNKYNVFVKPLVESIHQYFLPNHDKAIYLFTDKPYEHSGLGSGVTLILHPHSKWPGPTLGRYELFTKHAELLRQSEYLFYLDIDSLVVGKVGDEILPKTWLMGCLHPGFWNKPRAAFSYEDNPKSRFYLKPDEGKAYFCGGFQGGLAADYLCAAQVLSEMIKQEAKEGRKPRHDDESAWNFYLAHNPPSIKLFPAYMIPEECVSNPVTPDYNLASFMPKILALKKDHAKLRS